MQVNQIFYDPDLLLNVITKINEKYDFITSYNVIWDNHEYLLNDTLNFVDDKKIDKLSDYKSMVRQNVLDNAIFCLKMNLLKNVLNQKIHERNCGQVKNY